MEKVTNLERADRLLIHGHVTPLGQHVILLVLSELNRHLHSEHVRNMLKLHTKNGRPDSLRETDSEHGC